MRSQYKNKTVVKSNNNNLSNNTNNSINSNNTNVNPFVTNPVFSTKNEIIKRFNKRLVYLLPNLTITKLLLRQEEYLLIFSHQYNLTFDIKTNRYIYKDSKIDEKKVFPFTEVDSLENLKVEIIFIKLEQKNNTLNVSEIFYNKEDFFKFLNKNLYEEDCYQVNKIVANLEGGRLEKNEGYKIKLKNENEIENANANQSKTIKNTQSVNSNGVSNTMNYIPYNQKFGIKSTIKQNSSQYNSNTNLSTQKFQSQMKFNNTIANLNPIKEDPLDYSNIKEIELKLLKSIKGEVSLVQCSINLFKDEELYNTLGVNQVNKNYNYDLIAFYKKIGLTFSSADNNKTNSININFNNLNKQKKIIEEDDIYNLLDSPDRNNTVLKENVKNIEDRNKLNKCSLNLLVSLFNEKKKIITNLNDKIYEMQKNMKEMYKKKLDQKYELQAKENKLLLSMSLKLNEIKAKLRVKYNVKCEESKIIEEKNEENDEEDKSYYSLNDL